MSRYVLHERRTILTNNKLDYKTDLRALPERISDFGRESWRTGVDTNASDKPVAFGVRLRRQANSVVGARNERLIPGSNVKKPPESRVPFG
jgi:hypothetical protein